jgi:hypothetical protein
MGLLDGTTQVGYYTGNDFGGYQFTSLEDIINQFLVAYVGEEKIINKVSRTDVAFHAQRAMQELSFDIFKSIKSQEIVLPPTNTMFLPHDYVNYTKLSWSDSSGIKHPLYPTKDTSNPFKVSQNTNGSYNFEGFSQDISVDNADFSSSLAASNWVQSTAKATRDASGDPVIVNGGDSVETNANGQLAFKNHYDTRLTEYFSHQYAVWQLLELSAEATEASISANALSTSAIAGTKNIGVVRVGLSTAITGAGTQNVSPVYGTLTNYDPFRTNPKLPNKPSFNMNTSVFNLSEVGNPTQGSYIEFNAGDDTITTTSPSILIDVSQVPLNNNNKKEVFILIVSDNGITSSSAGTTAYTQVVDDIAMVADGIAVDLISDGESTTWTNYKSSTPSENTNQDYNYDTDTYDLNRGQRSGLDPQHAQTNGSFYIDNLKGLIHFSSNVSGKTVILDYISDSLGTDGEMQVHKFAEEALYKWIAHAVLSTKANTPEYIVNRYKKERFAATRQAKLRLSNIKLEELTQILRGKSKHIKH